MIEIDLGIEGFVEATQIGQGGSAVVYKGRQTGLDRVVAVKVLRSAWDESSKKRFDRERRAMGRLSEDTGIVPIYESGETSDGDPYIIMPYYEKGSLQQAIETDGEFHWEEAVELIDKVATTIAAAHRADVLHRDIKPANLLLTNNGRPLVSDFGIARIVSDSTVGRTTQSTFFTPAYSPPEAFSAGGSVEPTVDVYGLAATLWALLAGHPPFTELSEKIDPMTLFSRVAKENVGDLRATVPDSICFVVERSMAKKASDRPQSVDAFLYELREAVVIARSQESSGMELAPSQDNGANWLQSPWQVVPYNAEGSQSNSAVSAVRSAEEKAKSSMSFGRSNLVLFGVGGVALLALLFGLFALVTLQGGSSTEALDKKAGEFATDSTVSIDESEISEPVLFTGSEFGDLQLIVDKFSSVDRVVRNTELVKGSPIQLRTSVSQVTETSAVITVESNICTVALFKGGENEFATEGWPDLTNCSRVHRHKMEGLESGKSRYLENIELRAEGTAAVSTFVTFEVADDTFPEPLIVENLRTTEVSSDAVRVEFSTSVCSLAQIRTVFGFELEAGWPFPSDDNCSTEHSAIVDSLTPNSIYDIKVEVRDEDGRTSFVGMSVATDPVEGELPEIIDTGVENIGESSAEVWFETAECSSSVYTSAEGLNYNEGGCKTLHRHRFDALESETSYKVDVLARNEVGDSPVKTVDFTTSKPKTVEEIGPDQAAIISADVTDVTSTTARVFFSSNTCSYARYVDRNGLLFVSEGWSSLQGGCETEHQHLFEDLRPNTQYEFIVSSKDKQTGEVETAKVSFVTEQ